MSSHKGNTMFGVVGAVGCDCRCLQGCSREIGTNAICSQVMEAEDTIAESLDFTL